MHVFDILPNHADALRHLVDCLEHVFGELVEHKVQVAEKGTEGLPVIVLVVCVENKRVSYLALQVLDHGMIFPVLSRYFLYKSFGVGRGHNIPPRADTISSEYPQPEKNCKKPIISGITALTLLTGAVV